MFKFWFVPSPPQFNTSKYSLVYVCTHYYIPNVFLNQLFYLKYNEKMKNNLIEHILFTKIQIKSYMMYNIYNGFFPFLFL